MKTKLLASLILVLAGICAWQWRASEETAKRLSETERALQMERQAREAEEAKALGLEQQQSGLKDQIADLSSLVVSLRTAEAKRAANSDRGAQPSANSASAGAEDPKTAPGESFFGKGMSGMVSKMMKDPAMKDLMRTQQKATMNLMYGGLAKELKLTPEQNEKLTELILDQQMKQMESAESIFDKDTNAPITAIAGAVSDEQKQSDQSIKELLGEEKFAQYQDFKKTMAERMQLNMFKQQLEVGQTPLQEEQFRQLMAVMREEHEKNPPAAGEDFKSNPANLDKIFSGDLMEKQMQWQEQMNQRVLERAAQILTPEQLKAYNNFQTQQVGMQKFSLKMMRNMFGTKENAAAGTAPSK